MASNNETIRYDQKQTIAAYERQIQNIQQLLALQTNETKHCQDHILILNREVDALRKIIEEKQKSLHDLQRQLRKKQEFTSELEKKYDGSKIDRLAFFELEERNLQLLEGLKEKQTEIDKLQVENRFLQEHRDDRLLLEEIKAKKALELEITFPYERTQLQVRLDQAQEINNQQAMRIQILDAQVQQLTQQLEDHQERMKDSLLRSKQSEFKMLMELDSKDIENHALDIQNHQMQLTQKTLASQTSELAAQLNNSITQTETLQTLFSSSIHTLENDVQQLQYKEKMLLRENQMLQYEGQVQKDMIARASTALLESGKLPTKKEKKKGTKTNPLSLSATLPTMFTDTHDMNGSRPTSASAKQQKSSSQLANNNNSTNNKRVSTAAAASSSSSSQKGSNKRNPLNKFDHEQGDSFPNRGNRINTANNDQTNGNSSQSRLPTAVPKFQAPALTSSAPTTASTSTGMRPLHTDSAGVLSAFSPAATSVSVVADDGLKDFNWTLPPVTTAGNSPNKTSQLDFAGSQSLRLPQQEIVAIDLKNTMLHRFMQMTCRCYEAVRYVETMLDQQDKNKNINNKNIQNKMSMSLKASQFRGIDDEQDDEFKASSYQNPMSTTSSSSYWVTTEKEKNPFLSMGIVEDINLNNCSLVDSDLNAIIDWLRTVPTSAMLPYLHSISLQNNLLTAETILKIFAWVSSFSMADWQLVTDRGIPLEIDCKHNNIVYETLSESIQYMRRIGNPDIAYIGLLEESKERKILFHVKSRTHKQGSCIAMVFDISKQRGDHKNRILRNSLSSSWQNTEAPKKSAALSLSFREPIVSKIQTFTTESVYPILQTAGLISSTSSSFSPMNHTRGLGARDEDEDDFDVKAANTIPRDTIMKYDFIG